MKEQSADEPEWIDVEAEANAVYDAIEYLWEEAVAGDSNVVRNDRVAGRRRPRCRYT